MNVYGLRIKYDMTSKFEDCTVAVNQIEVNYTYIVQFILVFGVYIAIFKVIEQ